MLNIVGVTESWRNHCGESKTQRKCFLDEKGDGLVDENRINNQQNENRRFIHQKNRSVDLICFKQ